MLFASQPPFHLLRLPMLNIDPELELILRRGTCLRKHSVHIDRRKSLHYDISKDEIKPYIPWTFRRRVFNQTHWWSGTDFLIPTNALRAKCSAKNMFDLTCTRMWGDGRKRVFRIKHPKLVFQNWTHVFNMSTQILPDFFLHRKDIFTLLQSSIAFIMTRNHSYCRRNRWNNCCSFINIGLVVLELLSPSLPIVITNWDRHWFSRYYIWLDVAMPGQPLTIQQQTARLSIYIGRLKHLWGATTTLNKVTLLCFLTFT